MSEHMGVTVEVWPLAADETGIWLLADQAWQSGRIPADGNPAFEVGLLAYEHDAGERFAAMHSTSWRLDDRAGVILTYALVLDLGAGLVLDRWPDARPVTVQLLESVGKPYRHDPAGEPVPRHVDVLAHALRHLRFLVDTDGDAATALGAAWARQLADFRPVLAGLYRAA